MFDDIVFGSKWVHLLLFLYTFYGLFRVVWAFFKESIGPRPNLSRCLRTIINYTLKRVSFTKTLGKTSKTVL